MEERRRKGGLNQSTEDVKEGKETEREKLRKSGKCECVREWIGS